MGFLSGLVDSFTGKSARKDIDKGIAAVGQGRDNAIQSYQAAGKEAQGYMEPWRDRGGRRMYDASLGLNGASDRAAAQDVYTSDPILNSLREMDAKKAGWAFNSRGSYATPMHARADSENNARHYGDWQNRLAGVAGEEMAASGKSSDIAMGVGAGIAGAHQNATGQTAGLYGQRAQTQNALAQNLIGLGSVAASFANPFGFGANNLNGKGGYSSNGSK